MRVAALFSGGKDSNYALFWALHQGWDVPYLVTVRSKKPYSYMFQVPGIEITDLAAEAIGIEQIVIETTGDKESELEPLRDGLAKLDIDGIVSGALRSEYQRRRLDQICQQIGIRSFAPMWHKRSEKILGEMVSEGWEIMIVSVSAYGMGREWIGRQIDKSALEELARLADRYGINMDGEGGEFETVVLYGPTYTKRIVIKDSEIVWNRDSGHMIIKEASVE